MLTWLQFGDLHASEADNWDSLKIFSQLISDINRHLLDSVDFAVLPGDNANHATPDQFKKIADTISHLELPLHILPGDHDFETRSLADFYKILGGKHLPYSAQYAGSRCIFLDIVSAGSGGPDFGLGDSQMRWLSEELQVAQSDSAKALVFMHAYPTDLRSGGEELTKLFSQSRVAFVGTGHTHYNEIVNHEDVIYAATRSTGEVEEGPPGFSLGVLDGSVVSWHFKSIDATWPLVLITSPSDHRFISDSSSTDHVPSGGINVRAKIFGAPVKQVVASVWALGFGTSPPVSMIQDSTNVWSGFVPDVPKGLVTLEVEATTREGHAKREYIFVFMQGAGEPKIKNILLQRFGFRPIGHWYERSLLATQLGPNKNGRKW